MSGSPGSFQRILAPPVRSAVRDGPVVETSFYPELTDDPRIHDLALFETGATLPGRR